MSDAVHPGMDAETFDQFLEQLERYVRERLIPAEKDVIANDRIPDEIVAEMKDMGLFGLTVPEEFGGAGLNITQYAQVVKTMAYAAPAYRSIFSINVGMFNSAIKNGGTDAQKAEWWPRIAGGAIACFGLTEPGSGSDSAAMATTAKPDPDGNGWILNGTKRYITNAPHAEVAPKRTRSPRTRMSALSSCRWIRRAYRPAAPTKRWARPAAISPTSCSTTCMSPAMRYWANRPDRASASP